MLSRDELTSIRTAHPESGVVQKLLSEIDSLHGFLDECQGIVDDLRDETSLLQDLLSDEKARHLAELIAVPSAAPDALEEALSLIEEKVLFPIWEDGTMGVWEGAEADWNEMLGIAKDEVRFPTFPQYGATHRVQELETYRRLRRALPEENH